MNGTVMIYGSEKCTVQFTQKSCLIFVYTHVHVNIYICFKGFTDAEQKIHYVRVSAISKTGWKLAADNDQK